MIFPNINPAITPPPDLDHFRPPPVNQNMGQQPWQFSGGVDPQYLQWLMQLGIGTGTGGMGAPGGGGMPPISGGGFGGSGMPPAGTPSPGGGYYGNPSPGNTSGGVPGGGIPPGGGMIGPPVYGGPPSSGGSTPSGGGLGHNGTPTGAPPSIGGTGTTPPRIMPPVYGGSSGSSGTPSQPPQVVTNYPYYNRQEPPPATTPATPKPPMKPPYQAPGSAPYGSGTIPGSAGKPQQPGATMGSTQAPAPYNPTSTVGGGGTANQPGMAPQYKSGGSPTGYGITATPFGDTGWPGGKPPGIGGTGTGNPGQPSQTIRPPAQTPRPAPNSGGMPNPWLGPPIEGNPDGTPVTPPDTSVFANGGNTVFPTTGSGTQTPSVQTGSNGWGGYRDSSYYDPARVADRNAWNAGWIDQYGNQQQLTPPTGWQIVGTNADGTPMYGPPSQYDPMSPGYRGGNVNGQTTQQYSSMFSGNQPRIDANPILDDYQVQQLINRTVGQNALGRENAILAAQRNEGGSGFAGGGTSVGAKANDARIAESMSNANAMSQIPIQAAQLNIPQILAGQIAQEGQYANRQREGIASQGNQYGLLGSLFNPLLSLYGSFI